METIQDIIESFDSDDELLGINDAPVSSSTKCHQNHIHYLIPKAITYDRQKTANHKNIINELNIQKKIYRYQRMRDIPGIIGFVVNVHDATNFDIDLDMPQSLHERYQDVISNQYTYHDITSNFFQNFNLSKLQDITPSVGITYRCRLRGIGINQLPQHEHIWKANQMTIEIKQLIDRTDAWVICTLSDIDVYQRLLVDITINTCNGPIDLHDYLLSRMTDNHNPIFYPYINKKEFIDKLSL